MDNNKLRKVKLASILIILTFLTTSVLSVTSGALSPQAVTNSSPQVVGIYGDLSDSAINLGMEAYLDGIGTNFEVLSFNQILQFRGQIVIFAHGDEHGIKLSEKLTFTWDAFSVYLSSSKAAKIILASCFGANAITDSYTGPELFSWNGNIDALLIGYAAAYYTLQDQENSIDYVLNQLFSRATLLVRKEAEPVYLAHTPGGGGGGGGGGRDFSLSESGYTHAYKMQNTGRGALAGRIFWVNFDKNEAGTLMELHGALSTLMGEIAILNPPLVALLLAILAVNAVLILISKANRIRHDAKFGVQFFKYIPLVNFVYHNGNDGYKLSGIFYLPQICASGIFGYFGIANVPTYWTYVRM